MMFPYRVISTIKKKKKKGNKDCKFFKFVLVLAIILLFLSLSKKCISLSLFLRSKQFLNFGILGMMHNHLLVIIYHSHGRQHGLMQNHEMALATNQGVSRVDHKPRFMDCCSDLHFFFFFKFAFYPFLLGQESIFVVVVKSLRGPCLIFQ